MICPAQKTGKKREKPGKSRTKRHTTWREPGRFTTTAFDCQRAPRRDGSRGCLGLSDASDFQRIRDFRRDVGRTPIASTGNSGCCAGGAPGAQHVLAILQMSWEKRERVFQNLILCASRPA